MRPNTMNKFGVVLDDFGLETMLNKLMDDFVNPMARGRLFWFDMIEKLRRRLKVIVLNFNILIFGSCSFLS